MAEEGKLDFRVVAGKELSSVERNEIIALCDLAYEEDMGAILKEFVGPLHVLGYFEGRLVTHALWIERYLQPEAMPVMRTAYVEAVATHPEYRCRGFAGSIMKRVVDEIQEFDIAGLAPFSVDYYAKLGWELWRGVMFERKDGVLIASDPNERVMIYRLPKTPILNMDASISIEWRVGEVW